MVRRLSLVPLLLVGACAGDPGPYPSLAPRAGEKQGFEEPVVAAVPVASDPALDADIARWGTALDAQAAGFDAAAATARRAAAMHPAVGSDKWLDAQAAITALDDWRTRTTALIADIDAAGSARAARLAPPLPALDALRARGDAEAAREAEAAATIQAMVPAAQGVAVDAANRPAEASGP